MQFHYGTEFTFHCESEKYWKNHEAITERLWQLNHRAHARGVFGKPTCYLDSWRSLEFKSPILTTLEEFRWYYDEIHALARKYRLPIRPKGQTTGGGHLHQSQPGGWGVDLICWLPKDMVRRPYLIWLFLDPEDDESACDQRFDRFSRCWAVSPRYYGEGTFEFRLFEMPRSWDEQLLHLNFAEAYTAWAKTKVSSRLQGRVTRKRYTPKNYPLRRASGEAREFLAEIGLDPADYRGLLRRNLYKRYTPGYNLAG